MRRPNVVERYASELPAGAAPRVGLSRTVYPSRDPERAIADITRGLEFSAERACANGQAVPAQDQTIAEQFRATTSTPARRRTSSPTSTASPSSRAA